MSQKSILVIDDDKIILDSLREFLSLEGFRTSGAETIKEAMSKLAQQRYNLALIDVHLPDGNGLDLLDTIKKSYPQTVAIIFTGYGTIDGAVQSCRDFWKYNCCRKSHYHQHNCQLNQGKAF